MQQPIDVQQQLFGDKECSLSLPIIDDRSGLADILEAEGKTTGLEVGVRQGGFAAAMLSQWPKCTKYILMDPWAHQKNYQDGANVAQDVQNERMDETMQNMEPFEAKGVNIEYIRDYSENGHKKIAKKSLDFIYIDARHDYKGVEQDLEWMWPLLKEGGIFAGHDFCNADEEPAGRWCLYPDGTMCEDNKAVKAAVEEFAKKYGDLQIVVPRRETKYVSWYMRKPASCDQN